MAAPQSKPAEGFRGTPDLLRRLREFQAMMRPIAELSAKVRSQAPPATLSGAHAEILDRLRSVSTHLADGLLQAMRDLNDQTRLTYVGPAGEAREVLRSCVQLLAPDSEVRKQPWFVGVVQGKKLNPTQAERTRYAVQQRGRDHGHAIEFSEMIDERVGRLARMVYQQASAALHARNQRREVRVLVGYVFALLDDVLPEEAASA